MTVEGGAALPIVQSEESPVAGPAIPVYLYTSADLGNRRIDGGPTQKVYIVSDAQLAAGTFRKEGRLNSIPVIEVTDGRKVTGGKPIPVYVTNPGALSWYRAGGISASNVVAVYEPRGAANYLSSFVNVANPGTYDASGRTFWPAWDTVNGWRFDGVETCLRTGIYPVTPTWSMIIEYTGASSGITYLAGCFNAAYTLTFAVADYPLGGMPPESVGFWNGDSGGGLIITVDTGGQGSLAVAGLKGYINGIEQAGSATTGAGTLQELLIAGVQYDATPNLYYSEVMIQSVAIYNTALTGAQVMAVRNAMIAR